MLSTQTMQVRAIRWALQGSSSVSADFSTQVQRMKALGFNTVKLPFSFNTLLGGADTPNVPFKCSTATAAQIQVPSPQQLGSLQMHMLNINYIELCACAAKRACIWKDFRLCEMDAAFVHATWITVEKRRT